MALNAGSRLGPYDIVGALGAGGMGEVYRAHDPRLGRDVALKVLPAAVAADPARLARFEREARAVAALTHPNIVTLYSIEDAGGVRFLTMELVEGESLDARVQPGGAPVAALLDMAIPLAKALAAAHERGIVHRDLKPANVMIARDGTVKVLDFGLAKMGGADEPVVASDSARTMTAGAAPLSAAGAQMGTVPYMSPEQVRGEPADARSDLFAFGIVLYELATGRRPFGGATSADVSSAILRDTPPPPRVVRGELPLDLERIVTRCLAKDPRERFQTALDVANELRLVKRALQGGVAPRAAAPEETPSIAVLPFVNRSRDEEDAYFAEGLADEVLGVLAKIRGLRVASRSSAALFKDASEAPAAIGEKLNVATLLEGTVRKSGTRVRIAVQLIKAADGFHLWSETYDRTLDDIFAVQDDIAQAVVKELRTTLLGETPDSGASGEVRAEVARAARGRARDPESHRLYLEGRYFVNRLEHADMERGIALLRQAVAIDPANALAWAQLAAGLRYFSAHGFVGVAESHREAMDAARRAAELAPEIADGYIALGVGQLWFDYAWEAAEANFRLAERCAPDDPAVWTNLSIAFFGTGRLEEARVACERALALDPLSIIALYHLCRIHRSAGRYADAEAVARRAIEVSPGASAAHSLLASAVGAQGRLEDALAIIAREPSNWARWEIEAKLLHRLGRRDEARQTLVQLVAAHAQDAGYQIAQVYAVLGDADEAFRWLDTAVATHDPGIVFTLCSVDLRPLHGDPRWDIFLSRLGLSADLSRAIARAAESGAR